MNELTVKLFDTGAALPLVQWNKEEVEAWLEEQDRRGWELQSLSYWLPTARSPRPGRTSGTAWT